MSRFAVAIMYTDDRTAGRKTYKLRQAIFEAQSTAEALGLALIADNPKNYGDVMTYSVNHIEDTTDPRAINHMSNFREFFTHKASGMLHEIDCLDDYFGRRKYGYRPLVYGHTEVLTEDEFQKEYEKINAPGGD